MPFLHSDSNRKTHIYEAWAPFIRLSIVAANMRSAQKVHPIGLSGKSIHGELRMGARGHTRGYYFFTPWGMQKVRANIFMPSIPHRSRIL